MLTLVEKERAATGYHDRPVRVPHDVALEHVRPGGEDLELRGEADDLTRGVSHLHENGEAVLDLFFAEERDPGRSRSEQHFPGMGDRHAVVRDVDEEGLRPGFRADESEEDCRAGNDSGS